MIAQGTATLLRRDKVIGIRDVTGLLLSHQPGLAPVGLCEVGDEKLVASAMRAGARGCVDTGADGPELARAVIAAGRGQAILSGPALQRLHRGLQDDASGAALPRASWLTG